MLFQSETVTVEKDADGSAFLKIDVPGQTHNMISRQVLADLDAALDRVAEARLPLLVVRGGKPTGFLAGADLHGFLEIADEAAATALSARGQRLFDKLAALPMPTLAAIHGPCLGGGLELALACDYRLVLDNPKTQLGLPEVTLGLLPGWGGTQRLPRVVGLQRALEMILEGKRLKAREALRWGLADATPTNESELRTQVAYLGIKAIQQGKRPLKGLPLRTWGQRILESTAAGRAVIFGATERVLRRRVWDDMPAPAEALQAIRVGLKEGMAAGLAYERAAAGRLAVSPACRNLITLWLRGEKARKMPESLRAADPAEVRCVGVVGAGVMGAGIAQLAAIRGAQVVVREINKAALDAGMKRIGDLFDKAVGRRVLSKDEAKKRFAAVRGTTDWDGFHDVDVVVEAAVEALEAKRAVFHELDAHTGPTAVLATNTSSLRASLLEEGLAYPERVGGMHFFNPVHKMDLVEVVRTAATNERSVATLVRWAIALGKTPVVVRDSPGFVVNRVLTPYLNEATVLVAEGMKIQEIDKVMKRFGMLMGPLELLDQIGLDVAAHVARSLGPLPEGRFGTNPAFEKMRVQGWLGQKSGRGFYTHRGRARRTPNHLAENLLRAEAPGEGAVVSQALPPEAREAEARERLVLLMVNEAATAFGEGLAETAEAINLAMVLGTGWAPHRGGPLRYADERGLPAVVETLGGLAARHGRRFEPSAELKKRAESGEHFTQPEPGL